MWNRKKDEERAQRAAQTPLPREPDQSPKEVQSVSSMPSRSFDPQPQNAGGSATIGKAVKVKGQIFSREDLVIDGEIEGTVESNDHRLTIGPNGKVSAGVKAREIIVLGSIQGNVEASDRIEIRKDARLVGDIKTSRIVIEDGAYFKGSIDITREDRKAAPVQKPAPAPPAVVPAAAAGASEGKR
jgi:cytoskeletal protein CcmA (bactofilin family)